MLYARSQVSPRDVRKLEQLRTTPDASYQGPAIAPLSDYTCILRQSLIHYMNITSEHCTSSVMFDIPCYYLSGVVFTSAFRYFVVIEPNY